MLHSKAKWEIGREAFFAPLRRHENEHGREAAAANAVDLETALYVEVCQ